MSGFARFMLPVATIIREEDVRQGHFVECCNCETMTECPHH